MKQRIFTLFITLTALFVACTKAPVASEDMTPEEPEAPAIEEESPLQVSPIRLSTPEKSVALSGNEFGKKVFSCLVEDTGGKDILFSPLSLSLDLAVCASGASGNTQTQMYTAMGFADKDPETIADYYQKMTEALQTADPGVRFTSANSIWVHHDYTLRDAYVKHAKNRYDAHVQSLDLSVKESLGLINSWCKEKTEGLIDKMLDDSQDPRLPSAAYLLNAIYFQGGWSKAFDEKTQDAVFHSAKGDRMATYMQGVEYYGYREKEKVRMVSVNYGGGLYQLVIALPDIGVSTTEALASLEPNDFFGLPTLDPVTLRIPEFSISYNAVSESLIPALKKCGIVDAFSGNASFAGMFTNNLQFLIGNVEQKSFITVDRKGTEAAAVTMIAICNSTGEAYTPVPRTLVADRPFLFALVESSSRTILFLGQKSL